MGYRVLLVGSGGREHALAWKLLQSPLCDHLIAAPGNPGIEALGRGMAEGRVTMSKVGADATAALVALAGKEKVDLVLCGPEVPLMAGLGDACAAARIRFFGPSRAAAEIEGSKQFAKDLMRKAGIPTAAYGSFSDVAAADAFIDAQPGNVVVKADGLCAGKGVVVASTHDEAKQAVRSMLVDRIFGDAGARVVIEERLVGPRGFHDGPVRRHALRAARLGRGSQGGSQRRSRAKHGRHGRLFALAAGGQGTRRIHRAHHFAPLVAAMAEEGRPFRGLLYGGLMLTKDRGPMVIEWNCRFGDPETQAVLPRLDEDLLPWLLDAASGQLPLRSPDWLPGLAVCVVLAAEGYPGKVRSGDAIAGLGDDGQLSDGDGETVVFHAGTKRTRGRVVTNGGRVLGVTANGVNLEEARVRAYASIARINWPGMHFRKDIGLRGTP